MPDSTPGSTENPTPDSQQPSPDTTQQIPADPQTAISSPPPSTATDNSAEDNSAVVQTDDTNTDTTTDNSGDDNQGQDDVAEWAKKQGIDLDNPTPEQAKTLAKRLRDTQTAYHEANSKAKRADTSKITDLFQGDSGDEFEDPLAKEVRENSAKVNGQLSALAFREFVAETPEAAGLAGKMIEILDEEKEKYGVEAARLLSNNHSRLLTLAKAASLDSNTDAAVAAAREDERKNLANAQQAAGPSSNAVSSAPTSKKITDADIAKMTMAEYTEWRKTNNPWTTPLN